MLTTYKDIIKDYNDHVVKIPEKKLTFSETITDTFAAVTIRKEGLPILTRSFKISSDNISKDDLKTLINKRIVSAILVKGLESLTSI